MLTLLRDRSSPATEDAVSYEPARGLADLEPLVDTYRSAGLPVRTETGGDPAGAVRVGRPVRLPDRPGGAHQHASSTQARATPSSGWTTRPRR